MAEVAQRWFWEEIELAAGRKVALWMRAHEDLVPLGVDVLELREGQEDRRVPGVRAHALQKFVRAGERVDVVLRCSASLEPCTVLVQLRWRRRRS